MQTAASSRRCSGREWWRCRRRRCLPPLLRWPLLPCRLTRFRSCLQQHVPLLQWRVRRLTVTAGPARPRSALSRSACTTSTARALLQVIKPALLTAGFELVQRELLEVTDDVSIIEALGQPVKITYGSYANIKVLTWLSASGEVWKCYGIGCRSNICCLADRR